MNKDKMVPLTIVGATFAIGPDGDDIVTTNCSLLPKKEDEEHMRRIVSAVNNTYGAGINPEAVPELLDALKGMLGPFSHIGGVGREAKFKAREAAFAAIEKATIK